MKYYLLFTTLVLNLSCNDETSQASKMISYSSVSDKAKEHYGKGWTEIMDYGDYSAAEQSYRKALKNDSDFLIAKSVLARLTLDTNERLALYEDIIKNKNDVKGDERLLLDVYTAFVHLTNQRELFPERSKKTLDSALILAAKNLNHIVHSYPNEIYLKAEYIEILHSLYGPKRAIDSLNKLTNNVQKDNPFLLGYSATLHAEVGTYEIALQEAKRLESIINDSTIPKPYAVLAEVYLHMDSLEIAKKYAEKANHLDERNLDASRLLTKIDALVLKNSEN